MGNMEQQLRNATSDTVSHQLRDLWKNPRGTVIRIEVLALVAILLSFILAAFGSCRRWSNRWIIQKGFFAANALSLSLGTYSIGLMQSSSVKSEMYPIWAVSLLTLFGSIDSITSYNGLDYKSPLFKALFQLCLYCAYVLLISFSTISSDILKIAIGVLSAITFFKGLHRSLAFVLPSSQRNILRTVPNGSIFREFLTDYTQKGLGQHGCLVVDWPTNEVGPISGLPSMPGGRSDCITMNMLGGLDDGALESDAAACKGVCLSMALSHLLQQRYFFGLNSSNKSYCTSDDDGAFNFRWLLLERDGITGYDWAFKLVEVELAFLYDVFFTSNAFLHYYQAKGATIWTFASALGICFVGVAAAMPGARSSAHASPADTIVDSTAADVAITLVVLVSLALLQVLQALRCWTSNWARVALACYPVRDRDRKFNKHNYIVRYQLKLRAFFTRINWFDKQLWQNKLGQYSVIESTSTAWSCNQRFEGWDSWRFLNFPRILVRALLRRARVPRMLGIRYMKKVFWELFGGTTVDTVDLHPYVKASVAHVLGTQVAHDGRQQGLLLSPLLSARGLDLLSSSIGESGSGHRVPRGHLLWVDARSNYQENIWTFHVATCYCDLAKRKYGTGTMILDSEDVVKKDHHVATTLSKYCAYLSVRAPELLPGDDSYARYIHGSIMQDARKDLHGSADRFEAMEKGEEHSNYAGCYRAGINLGKRLQKMEAPERWSLLADFWVRALLEAAPSDNVGEHIRRLSQGGEFITHLWAFLYHAGIVEWQLHQEGNDCDRIYVDRGKEADDLDCQDLEEMVRNAQTRTGGMVEGVIQSREEMAFQSPRIRWRPEDHSVTGSTSVIHCDIHPKSSSSSSRLMAEDCNGC